MEKFSIELPGMFGDHHVVEVRRLLFDLPGVADVYASSAFRFVEVTYDPQKAQPEILEKTLQQAGYMEAFVFPEESGMAVTETGNKKEMFFRHTAAFTQTQQTVSFTQVLPQTARPLWPCPGMGPVRKIDED